MFKNCLRFDRLPRQKMRAGGVFILVYAAGVCYNTLKWYFGCGFDLKYGIWKIGEPDRAAARALCEWGLSPLNALVLAGRGYDTPEKAAAFFTPEQHLSDPFLLRDMDRAAARIARAMQNGETIAVFGDYDVDGITATCLLLDYLRSCGAKTLGHIPMRLEEGYGLNKAALEKLRAQGASLVVTVDCGITAQEEAAFCREIGLDLIITDHHECRDTVPDAVAVVNPHRSGNAADDLDFAGVGVAFKLVSALAGDQQAMLARYADLVCLGTVADVIPLVRENRCFVTAGLRALTPPRRLGLRALMAECNCEGKPVTAGTIGYILAPRINAAGRMGRSDIALELFLTESPVRAAELAAELCRLNRQRQSVEQEIYAEAQAMLAGRTAPGVIVLASDHWHQGVVGIVASRLAEEYACPAFLICLDGAHGKASSRSYGGFNLFAALEQTRDLLEGYGGHELAAGFTIDASNVDAFRTRMEALAAAYAATGQAESALQIDCAVTARALTQQNVADLDLLEPCSAGFPSPVFCMQGMQVVQLGEVGGGKHLRLRLSDGRTVLGAIFFNHTAAAAGVAEGDTVEVAFTPQINEYRGMRSVQLNLTDIRPAAPVRAEIEAGMALLRRHRAGQALTADEAGALLPPRADFVAVWRYLCANAHDGALTDDLACMQRKLMRAGAPLPLGRMMICLDVLHERGLITLERRRYAAQIRITAGGGKVDLTQSPILLQLRTWLETSI